MSQPLPLGMRHEQPWTVPLVATEMLVRVHELLAVVRVRQRYRNRERKPIEAVASFPVPKSAVLLDVQAEIAGRRFTGAVLARDKAEERYEEAIAEGDAALLLEELEPGAYALHLGNLKPREEAVITYRYAWPLAPTGGVVRLAIPTTIAPRYGHPAWKPEVDPEISLTVRHELNLRVRVSGLLAKAEVESPTHAMDVHRADDELLITTRAKRIAMDRDIVLMFRLHEAPHAMGWTMRSSEGWLSMAMFVPEWTEAVARPARTIKLVCDCSGSMTGDSIAIAREAALALLDALEPRDAFAIWRFGSVVEVWHREIQPATGLAVVHAQARIRAMEADLGGTELGQALEAALTTPPTEDAEIVLITDAEVWAADEVLALVRRHRHRLFVVGVGASPNAALVERLAEATGGAYLFITPNEDARTVCSARSRASGAGAQGLWGSVGLSPCAGPGRKKRWRCMAAMRCSALRVRTSRLLGRRWPPSRWRVVKRSCSAAPCRNGRRARPMTGRVKSFCASQQPCACARLRRMRPKSLRCAMRSPAHMQAMCSRLRAQKKTRRMGYPCCARCRRCSPQAGAV